MRYIDLLGSAISNAQRGLTPEQAIPIEDAWAIADTLFPITSQGVCESAAASEYRRSIVQRQQDLTLVAGTATLSGSVLTHYMTDSVLIDPANLNKHYAFRQYPDFIKRGDKRLGIYTIQGDRTLQVIEPNGSFAVPLTATGARTLTAAMVVEKPTLYTDQVDTSEEMESDLIEALSEALRGQIIKQAGAAA